MTTPAQIVVEKFGGKDAFQQKFKISANRLYRWLTPKAKGGTGGRIPPKHFQKLLDLARAEGVDLKVDDFFTAPEPKRKRRAA